MSLGRVLWLIAVIIAVVVGLNYFGGISIPVITPALMRDSTMSLFVALALSLLAKLV